MNRLLLHTSSIVPISDTAATAVVDGRQAAHLRTVIKPHVGATLRAGILGGVAGDITITHIVNDSYHVTFEVANDAAAQGQTLQSLAVSPWNVHLILAMPRPKVLSRVLQSVASFGVASVALTNAWRVDKSYLGSARLLPSEVAAALQLGAEQGGFCYQPAVTVYDRFTQMIDADVQRESTSLRLLAHPAANKGIERWQSRIVEGGDICVAIGPEGGWIDREVETFCRAGFTQVLLVDGILRVETAVAAVLGQLSMLSRMSRHAVPTVSTVPEAQ